MLKSRCRFYLRVRELNMPNRFWTLGILIFALIVLGLPLSSQAAEGLIPTGVGTGTAKEPWDIEARELTYDQDTDTYTAIGEVVIKQGTQVLKCDYAEVDRQTMIAKARGTCEIYFSRG